MRIQTVLCPIDFSTLSDRELQVAVEICETFDARLVLHHNLDFAPAAWSKAWEWEETHPEEEGAEARAQRNMQTLLGRLPDAVRAEATISRGLVVPVLLHLAQALPADLLVLGSHGWSTDDHASVADRIVENCPCPVLTLHDDDDEDGEAFRLRDTAAGRTDLDVLVPTDFSDTGDTALRYAFDLARTLLAGTPTLKLHLLHIVAAPTPPPSGEPSGTALARLRAQVPEDLAPRVECAVKSGPVADTMVDVARRMKPRLIVMGRHAHGFWRHFFTRDTSRQMLHRASCPVLFAS